MKLGLGDEVGGPKMAKTWFTALLAAAALLLGPGLAAGQDMSFDLDEAESAGGEGEAEAGTAAVRVRGAGKKQVILPRERFLDQLRTQTESKTLELGVE